MIKRLLTSCFGLGWMPVAPGTWGSLPPALLFGTMMGLGASVAVTGIVMGIVLLVSSIACVAFAPAVITATGKKDPGEVVADEVAGQAIPFIVAAVLWPAGLTGMQVAGVALAGFLLFRLFDITKPWPCKRLEGLPAGWGILADDLMAGFFAGIVLGASLGFIRLSQAGVMAAWSPTVTWGSALALGVFQGVTEFLPVSSSGHLVLLETLLGLNPESSAMLLFDLAAHTGTILAILVVLRKSLFRFSMGLNSGWQSGPLGAYQKNPNVRLLVLTILATGVTGVLGLLLKKYFLSARGSLAIVASMWIITSIILFLTEAKKRPRGSLRSFGLTGALMVGLAQAAAVMPGISRSGSTICAAILLCGLRRRWAVEFGILLAVPAVLGATLLEALSYTNEANIALPLGPILLGSLVAFLTGVPAMHLLMRAFKKSKLKPFAIYCISLAIFSFLVWGLDAA